MRPFFSSKLHGLVTNSNISTNYKYGYSSESFNGYTELEPEIVLTCIKDEKFSIPDRMESLSMETVVSDNCIYRYKKLPFVDAKFKLDLSVPRRPVVTFNKDYEMWSSLRGTCAFFSIEEVLEHVSTATLLSNKVLPIHCAAIEMGKACVILIAPSNTGKTLTSYLLQKDYDGLFMSEDIALLSDSTLYGCPFTSTDLPEGMPSKPKPKSRSIVNRLFFPSPGKESLGKNLDPTKLKLQGRPTHLIFLSRGEESVRSMSRGDAMKMLIKNNLLEFHYRDNVLLQEAWYRYGLYDIPELHQVELDLLNKLTMDVDEITFISNINPRGFAELVHRVVVN